MSPLIRMQALAKLLANCKPEWRSHRGGKQCEACFDWKPIEDFYATRHGTRENKCKRCRISRVMQRRAA